VHKFRDKLRKELSRKCLIEGGILILKDDLQILSWLLRNVIDWARDARSSGALVKWIMVGNLYCLLNYKILKIASNTSNYFLQEDCLPQGHWREK
jgi:hypothetical protein